jgi:serine/threonine protein phosphatase 1
LQRFVSRWLGGGAESLEPFLPPGHRLYCIGDIHGKLDLLQELHGMIVADAADFGGDKTLVYLGDYIDRGEQSKQVVDLLLDHPLPGFEIHHLMGNHEQTLLDFLQHPRAAVSWLTYGGRAALRSYGVALHHEFAAEEEVEALRDDLETKLPGRHLQFFQSLEPFHVAGSYGFVHAGIRPGVPLRAQNLEDLLWIRYDFTDSSAIHELIIVHGHTIAAEVQWRRNRIGIDTGAFYTGVLTCLVLEGSDQRLLQTGAAG